MLDSLVADEDSRIDFIAVDVMYSIGGIGFGQSLGEQCEARHDSAVRYRSGCQHSLKIDNLVVDDAGV